jgi:hypothetical protein
MLVWLYWVISLTIVTYASAYIVKNYKEWGFAALTSFYTIYLGASQILASRAINFDLGFYLSVHRASNRHDKRSLW